VDELTRAALETRQFARLRPRRGKPDILGRRGAAKEDARQCGKE
jgi:hypothetical protein